MITVKKEKQSLLSLRHPWLFRQTIAVKDDPPENGEMVPVYNQEGEICCWGFYSAESYIAVRIISFGRDMPSGGWLERRIHNAAALRQRLFINSNSYRLVNAEGDGIPGLIIDVYHTTIVLKPLVYGIEKEIETITAVLSSLFPEKAVYLRRDEFAARKENLTLQNGYIKGEGDGIERIEENGIGFLVDIKQGQKTGFYLDQRDNRSILSRYCKGKTVLNCFSYTGAFALAAAKGGALRIVSVESSAHAVELSHKQLSLNPEMDESVFTWICGDAFEFLEGCESFDIIVLDPPPFARRKAEVEGALKGYRRLAEKAIRKCHPDGIIAAFSCSSSINKTLFRETVREAAVRTGRELRIIGELAASQDHPVSLFHPEGEYLKGLMLYAE
ncbi:MAG: class I SAM-dependent rRNA methyltransferase [Spirochaetales bacterium]|nr:class I SAM-dependent rRNA methyltransferase [Spirochaetales bacterium]